MNAQCIFALNAYLLAYSEKLSIVILPIYFAQFTDNFF